MKNTFIEIVLIYYRKHDIVVDIKMKTMYDKECKTPNDMLCFCFFNKRIHRLILVCVTFAKTNFYSDFEYPCFCFGIFLSEINVIL